MQRSLHEQLKDIDKNLDRMTPDIFYDVWPGHGHGIIHGATLVNGKKREDTMEIKPIGFDKLFRRVLDLTMIAWLFLLAGWLLIGWKTTGCIFIFAYGYYCMTGNKRRKRHDKG